MLEEYTITSGSGTAFQKHSKDYNVNMTVKIRTLHRKGCCKDSDGMTSFIPFDSLEDVKRFEEEHNITFRRCGHCFKQGRK